MKNVTGHVTYSREDLAGASQILQASGGCQTVDN